MQAEEKIKEAERLMEILLPVKEFGENPEAEQLMNIIESLASNIERTTNVPSGKAFLPILLETITEELFNERDLYFLTQHGDLQLCIAWSECEDKKETHMDWYILSHLPKVESVSDGDIDAQFPTGSTQSLTLGTVSWKNKERRIGAKWLRDRDKGEELVSDCCKSSIFNNEDDKVFECEACEKPCTPIPIKGWV